MYPNMNGGLFSRGLSLLKNIDFAGVLDGTSKTLTVINQAIPVYYQVKPIVSNLRTISKIQNVLKEDEPVKESSPSTSPIFYL